MTSTNSPTSSISSNTSPPSSDLITNVTSNMADTLAESRREAAILRARRNRKRKKEQLDHLQGQVERLGKQNQDLVCQIQMLNVDLLNARCTIVSLEKLLLQHQQSMICNLYNGNYNRTAALGNRNGGTANTTTSSSSSASGTTPNNHTTIMGSANNTSTTSSSKDMTATIGNNDPIDDAWMMNGYSPERQNMSLPNSTSIHTPTNLLTPTTNLSTVAAATSSTTTTNTMTAETRLTTMSAS